MDHIKTYLAKVEKQYKTGIAREHAYRGDLQHLLDELTSKDVLVTNEPARVKCGAPDYILTKKNIPVGYIEAKDVGKPLDSKDYKEQFDRYRGSLHNLIITDYLDFWLYRNGERVATVTIAEIKNKRIKAKPENFDNFLDLIKDFSSYSGQTITSAQKLSKMMAGKARLLATVIENALTSDEEGDADSTLKDQMKAFQKILIHDIKAKGFADIYAQTIAYGMFAARLHDPTLNDFSRQEAAELIPQSNPFLRKLFQYIAGYDLDDRIRWIVDELADIFRATDVAKLLENFGKATQKNDPIIHFYETFLAEYDPKLRKSRGVWYTPEPVVNFIVRGVDYILKTEFNLKDGLADTTKTTIEMVSQAPDARTKTGYKTYKKEVHKVQILDPAAGTGTFLAEVIKQIYTRFEGQQGIWSNYVENELIPRLNGFEVLMASYAMAHLKLDLLLRETGYKPKKQKRLNVYLTNSLEEHHPDTDTLFATWLSNEASAANHIKRDTPVMVVMGNPPYSLLSSNLSAEQRELINKYKYIDGEKIKEKGALQFEKNLNDDYVKFISLAQRYIEKNGTGLLAYVNNHNFLDSPTFRGMRWSLLNTFDHILVLDLHGNTKKIERSPDGTVDNNVFDIQQGVSINIFIKTGIKKKGTLAKVMYSELWGNRQSKYARLREGTLDDLKWEQVNYKSPTFVFVPKDYKLQEEYDRGFSLTDLFPLNSTGVVTARDKFTIDFDRDAVKNRVQQFLSKETEESRQYYDLGKDTKSWSIRNALDDVHSFGLKDRALEIISYRPFDYRWTYYTGKVNGFYTNPRKPVMQHFLGRDNIGLCFNRRIEQKRDYADVFVFSSLIQHHSLSIKEVNTIAPLYIYPAQSAQQDIPLGSREKRTPNINTTIVNKIAETIDQKYTEEKTPTVDTFSPIDVLDYVYAVLFSPNYRHKYSELLKEDFPKVCYPTNKNTFYQLVKLGQTLREIHLLESPILENCITTYPIDGNNTVTRRINKKDYEMMDAKKEIGRVWINNEQYFDKVPGVAWYFHIGSYKPAQKWLKDRFGRALSVNDVRHYQKIIVSLVETNRIMKKIDEVIEI